MQTQDRPFDDFTERRLDLYRTAYDMNALITIQLPINGVDELNANESETFTLEEYRKIILDFRCANKDFILARVTTPDPYRHDILYNYYYIASEVNKVLFKYESSRKLLHRMKVRNPLNNMYIIGQVQYFRITRDEVDRALVDCFFRNLRLGKESFLDQSTDINAFSAVFRSVNSSNTSLISTQTDNFINLNLKNDNFKNLHGKNSKIDKSDSAKKNSSISNTHMKIKSSKDKLERDYTNTLMKRSVSEILLLYDNYDIEIPHIPEEYINKCTDIDDVDERNSNRNGSRDEENFNNNLKIESDRNIKDKKNATKKDIENKKKTKTQKNDSKIFTTPFFINYRAEFFATDDDFLLKNTVRDYFKQNSVDPSEDFLFELDRTENDLFAILETPSSSDNEEALSWKRMLTFHLSLLLTLVGVVVLLGVNPIAVIITLPLAIFVFLSFLCSLVYILCVRRSSFDSLAVRSVDEM